MKNINEEKILANLYVNLKGKKRKRDNWIKIAENCKILSDYYKSDREVAEKLGVSYELIRSILKLLKLPKYTQQKIKEGEILYDAGQRIMRIKGTENQIKVTKVILNLNSHDARDIIQYAKKNPNTSLKNLEDFKKRILKSKMKPERINVLIIPFVEEDYKILKRFSKKRKISTEKLAKEIIQKWVKEKKG